MASTNKDRRRVCGVTKCHQHRQLYFVWLLLILMIFINSVVSAKDKSPPIPPSSEDHESLWSYLTSELFKWSSLNDIDPDSFWAKFIHFTKHEDFEDEEGGDTDFSPAVDYRDKLGLKAHFPVVMIPGMSSSTMESWGTSEKYKNFFRKRIFGTYDMIQMVVTNSAAWFELMRLDPITGLDPEGIKLRATEGFDAADYVLPGYWVWSKILKNLSAIGYDSSNLYMASYDWRLSLELLEHRDRFFSKLKDRIEHNKRVYGRRTVIMGHSMGSSVLHYFLKWVEYSEGGNGGDQWTEDHVESVVHIAGALLGTPKALTFILSGDTHEIKTMGKLKYSFFERFVCRKERVDLFRNWGASLSIIPKGGNKIWGDLNGAPDDIDNAGNQPTFGEYISFLPAQTTEGDNDRNIGNITLSQTLLTPLLNHTVDSTMTLLESMASPEFINMIHNNYSHGITTSKKQLKDNDAIPRKWTNPLESKLPNAPSTTIYNLYGVGTLTERSYYFRTPDVTNLPSENDKCKAYGNAPNVDGVSPAIPLVIDSSITDHAHNIEFGVRTTDGDYTVPVFSNGFMSSPLGGGWTEHADLYNPGQSRIVAREYKHKTTKGSVFNRGAPDSTKHVEILGNGEVLVDLLQIVSNNGENVTQRLYSNIEIMAQQVSLDHQA